MASAANISWINPAGGAWTNVANWSTGSVPGSGDNVFITNGAGYTVTVQQATFAQLTLGGANGGQRLAWEGGAFNGIVRIQPSGELRLQGSADKSFSGGALTNRGSIRWMGAGNFYIGNSVVYNEPSGVIEAENDSILLHWFGTVGLINQGVLRKTMGTGITTVGLPVQNTGLIQAQLGTVRFNAGLALHSVGTLGMVIHGASQFGRIEATGALALDGGLEVGTGLNYVPQQDASYSVLGFGTRTGEFSRMSGLGLGGGLFLQPVYTASAFLVTVGSDTPPFITLQPKAQVNVPGGHATFHVEVGGPGPFTYQWYYEETPLPGETSDTLSIANVQPSDAGRAGWWFKTPLGR